MRLLPFDRKEANAMTNTFDPDRTRSACFTGHRPRVLKNCRMDDLRLALHNAIQEAVDAGYERFYCGMAMGSDILAGELVVSLREQFPWIKLICVFPFLNQTESWPEEWQKRYHRLLDKADDEVTIIPADYFTDGYLVRDRYMVDHSSLLIGIYNGSARGGTAYTVKYARSQGLETRLIEPGKYRF